MKLPLVGESYSLRSPAAAMQQCVNLMPQAMDDPMEKGKNIGILQGCPGYHELITLPGGGIRGLWSGGGRLFAVSGAHLYEVGIGTYFGGNPSGGVGAVISDHVIGDDGNPVQMFGNGTQLLIVANGYAYIDNGAGPVRCRFQVAGYFTTADGQNLVWASGDKFPLEILGLYLTYNNTNYLVDGYTDDQHIHISVSLGAHATPVMWNAPAGDYVDAVTGAYLDSTFYVQRPDSVGRQVNFSGVNDGTYWAGLDFFIKEGYPDHIQSILADKEQLYVFGTESGEVWQNDPSTGRPVRIPGAAARQGSAARWAPVSLGGKVYFIGGGPTGSPIAYRLDGFTPTRISTHALETAWQAIGETPTEACAYASIEDGHLLWVINFAGNLRTWVYDATASAQFGAPMWHQRAYWNGASYLPYRPWYHTFIPEWGPAGMHIGGDYLNGKLYEINAAYPDQNGADSKWTRILPYAYAGRKRVFFGRMDLEMATGTALSGGEPNIVRDYSDDQGANFVNPQTAGIGAPGDGTRRVYWPTGGSSRSRLWRFSGTGKVPTTLIDLECEVTPGIV